MGAGSLARSSGWSWPTLKVSRARWSPGAASRVETPMRRNGPFRPQVAPRRPSDAPSWTQVNEVSSVVRSFVPGPLRRATQNTLRFGPSTEIVRRAAALSATFAGGTRRGSRGCHTAELRPGRAGSGDQASRPVVSTGGTARQRQDHHHHGRRAPANMFSHHVNHGDFRSLVFNSDAIHTVTAYFRSCRRERRTHA